MTYCFLITTFTYFSNFSVSLNLSLFLSLHVFRSDFMSRRDHWVLKLTSSAVFDNVQLSVFISLYWLLLRSILVNDFKVLRRVLSDKSDHSCICIAMALRVPCYLKLYIQKKLWVFKNIYIIHPFRRQSTFIRVYIFLVVTKKTLLLFSLYSIFLKFDKISTFSDHSFFGLTVLGIL